MASAPRSEACWIIRSKASERVRPHNLVNSEMLPPTRVCSPAPIVPTIERDLTTIPRTTPRLRLTRKPGNSNAVVTHSEGTMPGSDPPVDLDDRRVLDDDGLFEPISDSITSRPIHGALGAVSAHHGRPFLPEEQIRTRHRRQPRQSVVTGKGFAERDPRLPIHSGQIAEGRENPRPSHVAGPEVFGRLSYPLAPAFGIHAGFVPGDPVLRAWMQRPVDQAGGNYHPRGGGVRRTRDCRHQPSRGHRQQGKHGEAVT